MNVLGLTGGFHLGSCDATAAVVSNGTLLAAIEEERLTRSKHSYARPPARCMKSCLDLAGLSIADIDVVTIYVDSYDAAVQEMREHIMSLFGTCPAIQEVNHHRAHAASTYYASGFHDAAVVNFDWSGDQVSTSIWHGRGNELDLIEAVARPNSLGIFYSAFTQFLGFERGDEYKVMGLSSYGQPTFDLTDFLNVSNEVYEVNPGIFDSNNRSLYQLVLGPLLKKWRPDLRRHPYEPVTQAHKDLAASVQAAFETAVISLVKRAKRLTGTDRLCLAGGGGLNCRANGRIVAERLFDEVYVPPFPNDTGCAFGTAATAAVAAGHRIEPVHDAQLGPGFTDEQIKSDLDVLKCPARFEEDIAGYVAEKVCQQKLVGWHQGRMEVGPRALGGRSILTDPRAKDATDRINKCVKFRETFRPFAPSVLVGDCPQWFDFHQPSPFMSFVADVKVPQELPAITHVDGTARIQTVADNGSPYAAMLQAMKERTGYSCVLNTSFNYMGQPVVCTPKEAICTFFGTGLDVLALGHWIVEKPV